MESTKTRFGLVFDREELGKQIKAVLGKEIRNFTLKLFSFRDNMQYDKSIASWRQQQCFTF